MSDLFSIEEQLKQLSELISTTLSPGLVNLNEKVDNIQDVQETFGSHVTDLINKVDNLQKAFDSSQTKSHHESREVSERLAILSEEVMGVKSTTGSLDNSMTRLRDDIEFVKSSQSFILSGSAPQRSGLASGPPGLHVHEPRSMFRFEHPYRR